MFNKVFNAFAVVLFTLQVFTAGADFADNHFSDGVINLVLAGFWGSILLIEVIALNRRANVGNRLANIMDNAMHDLVHFLKQEERNDNAKKATTQRGSRATAPKRPGTRSGSKVTNRPVRSGSKGTSTKTRNKS